MLKAGLTHVRRRPATLAALAAAGLTSIAVAGPVLARSGASGRTITFREANKGSRFHYIDNPPRNAKHARPTFSMGDQFVISNPLVNGGGKIGELRAICTITKGGRAPQSNSLNPAHPFCTGAFVTKKGTLFVETVAAGAKVTTGAVVGGAGAYAGARGTFTSTTTKSGANDVVKLQR
jgi:hypothetical protein